MKFDVNGHKGDTVHTDKINNQQQQRYDDEQEVEEEEMLVDSSEPTLIFSGANREQRRVTRISSQMLNFGALMDSSQRANGHHQ